MTRPAPTLPMLQNRSIRRPSFAPFDGPPEAERLLLIRLGALGDVVRTLPAASALRDHYAGSHLSWLVEPRCAGVLRSQSWIDEVVEFPRPALARAWRSGRLAEVAELLRSTASGLRRRRFDLVVDFHSILKSGILSRLSGAPLRVACGPPQGREGAWWFANRPASIGRRPLSRFDRNLALVRHLGIDAAPRSAPLEVSTEARHRIRAALREHGLAEGEPFVALHPGSSPATPHKRWSAGHHGTLARALRARRGLPSLVVSGSDAGETALADEVVQASGGAARRAPATVDFASLAALLEAARLFVGSDSGPLHAASLLGTPVVQVLGPTHPVENEPWRGTPSRQVRVPVSCSPCRRGCAAAHCQRVVPPEHVIEAALDLLDARAHPGVGVRLAG